MSKTHTPKLAKISKATLTFILNSKLTKNPDFTIFELLRTITSFSNSKKVIVSGKTKLSLNAESVLNLVQEPSFPATDGLFILGIHSGSNVSSRFWLRVISNSKNFEFGPCTRNSLGNSWEYE